MVDRTYREAWADNALVWENPGAGQELITGAEVFGATGNGPGYADSGILFSELQKWILETYGSGVMFAATYDTDGDGNVNAAESVNDGAGNVKTAAEIAGHLDDTAVHAPLNDLQTLTTNLWSASKINSELGAKTDQSAFLGHTGNETNPHNTTHAQLSDGGANAHSVIDAHLAIVSGNPHGVTHGILPDIGVNSHLQIDSHIGIIAGNPHGTTHAQVAPTAFYSHSQIDGHINSKVNPHEVTAAQANAAPDTHPGDTSHLTLDERNALTNASPIPTAANPIATIANIPPGSGHVIQDEGVGLPQQPNLNFIGPTVTVTDDPSAPTGPATRVEITAQGDVTGPASSVDLNLAAFDGVTGKLLQDSTYRIPSGGAIGQVLGKASASDYDMAWITQSGGGGIPEAPNDSYNYGRKGGTTNDWFRTEQVFEQASAPGSGFAIGDVWLEPGENNYNVRVPTNLWLDALDSTNQKFDGTSVGMAATDAQAGIIEAYLNAAITDLTDAIFPTWAAFQNRPTTIANDGGNTDVNFSSSNKHELAGTATTTINTFTFPAANAHYFLVIPATVTVQGVSGLSKREYGQNDFTPGKAQVMSIFYDGITAHWQTSEEP